MPRITYLNTVDPGDIIIINLIELDHQRIRIKPRRQIKLLSIPDRTIMFDTFVLPEVGVGDLSPTRIVVISFVPGIVKTRPQ